MARAIGWYVHYTATGYETKGIAAPHEQPKKGWPSQRKAILNRAKSLSQKLSKEDFEDLQSIFKNIWNKASQNIAVQNAVKQDLIKKHGEVVDKVLNDMSFTTGQVNRTSEGITKFNDPLVYLDQYVKELIDLINDENGDLMKASKGQNIDKNTVIKKLNAIRKGYAKIINEENGFAQQVEKIIGSNTKAQLFGKGSQQAYKNLSKMKEKLNNIMQDTNLGIPPIALIKGELFEDVVKYLPQLVENCAHGALGNTIKSLGRNKEKIYYDVSAFEQHGNLSKQFRETYKDSSISTDLMEDGESQGKIDISLEWKNRPLNLSLKNYDLSKAHWVHLVSGSPLLYLIQDLNRDFVNHFINIYSKHYTSVQSQKQSRKNFKDKNKQLQDEMLLILLYKAISGDNVKRNPASIFVLNDSSTGNVLVYTIADILEKVEDNVSMISAKDSSGKGLREWSLFENKWAPQGYQARINSLLQEIHKRKISVSIKTSFFK